MPTVRRVLPLLIVALGVQAGCSQEMPPESISTTSVTGQVRVGSTPVDGGWVEFLPIDGTIGPLRSAPLGPRGRFTAHGVAIGRNAIRLVDPPFPLPPASPNPRIRFEQFTSPIRRDVQPSKTLDIDLLSERTRLARLDSGGSSSR